MAASLAVRYRPKTIAQLLGQESAVNVVTNIVKPKGKIPSCILIIGDTGLGKTTTARIIARTVNCHKGTGCSKDKCISCESFDAAEANGANFEAYGDYLEQNAATLGGKDDVKRLIDISHYAPQNRQRFLMVDEAHNLTSAGMQALLKDTEEPRDRTTWIVATTNPEKLPRALAGRSVTLYMRPVPVKELAKRLFRISKREKFPLKAPQAIKIAEYSGGMVRNSIAMLEKIINDVRGNGKLTPATTDKAIEDCFFRGDEMLLAAAVAGLLLALYEKNPAEALNRISGLTDPNGTINMLSRMNGFALYSIVRMNNPKIRNPYYATPENRLLWQGVQQTLKEAGDADEQKALRKQFFRNAVELQKRIVDLRVALFGGAGAYDATGLYVAYLLA